jgi:hypothetical protein
MTTTTFKSVGGTSNPAKGKQKAALAAAKKKPAAKPEAPAKAATAAKPARDPNTVTIKGEGTLPVFGDGAMRRLPKGKPVKVSAAELAFLKRSKVALA